MNFDIFKMPGWIRHRLDRADNRPGMVVSKKVYMEKPNEHQVKQVRSVKI